MSAIEYNNAINNLAVKISRDITSVDRKTGVLTDLNTTNKESIVKAINELRLTMSNASSINDSGLQTSTTESLSINGTVQLLNQRISALLGGASTTADTLKELQTLIESNDSDINSLLTSLGQCIRYNIAQSLTDVQKNQAIANIGLDASGLLDAYNDAKNP